MKFFVFLQKNLKCYKVMEKDVKASAKKRKPSAKPKQKRKSKTTLFWEKYPNGILRIIDLDAVLE
jgi:hypothetical protein